MNIYTARFPDQGMCGGGMIVLANSLNEAKKKLRDQFKEDCEEDWHSECINSLEQAGFGEEDDVISFFTD